MAKPLPSLDRLREVVDYDPNTGIFTWRKVPGRRGVKAGTVAGSVHRSGSIRIKIDQEFYQAHRLAWMLVYGIEPRHEIDHMDGNPANNRISNLRDVTHQINIQNQRRAQSHSKSGVLGVSPFRDGFAAFIKPPNGKHRNLGVYKTIDEARCVYLAAKRELHQGNTL